MRRKLRGKWEYIINDSMPDNKEEITGRYLFFGSDREQLVKLAERLLDEFGLRWAKIPVDWSETYVLFVFDEWARYKFHMKQYAVDGIEYRYWKPLMPKEGR